MKKINKKLLTVILLMVFVFSNVLNVSALKYVYDYGDFVLDHHSDGSTATLYRYDGNKSEVTMRIPLTDSCKRKVTSIGAEAFSGNTYITKLNLSEGIASIQSKAFKNCSKLNTIYIPESVTSIAKDAFTGCSSLKYINFGGCPYQWKQLVKSGIGVNLNNVVVSCYKSNYFFDVSKSDYFYYAVYWAYNSNITAGVDEVHFVPNRACTRAEVVTFLWRMNGSIPSGGSKSPFVDVKAGSYYADAVAWAYSNGITYGKDATHFNPNGLVTRAEFVTFLWRTVGEPFAWAESQFTDVPENAYYADAVDWAAGKGIAAGVTANTFGPNMSCTRAQTVTFLYRYATN